MDHDWNETERHSIAGGWLGTYAYDSPFLPGPVRFEATFDEGHSGAFSGKILDDSPVSREAAVDGAQSGRTVRFVKTYLPQQGKRNAKPIDYSGIMADDGLTMRGTWLIRDRLAGVPIHTTGVWDARRIWNAESAPHVGEEPAVNTTASALPALI